jgi:RHS repeat-associated protein
MQQRGRGGFEYTSFGSGMKTRGYSPAVYRYGFNGKELDGETVADAYDFGARIYDARLGRWMAVDPMFKCFAYFSSYIGLGNSPLFYIDRDGRIIDKPSPIVSYTGPANPTCTGQIGHTKGDPSFVYSEESKSYNFRIETMIVYSPAFYTIADRNFGFKNFLETHEMEHVLRFHQAADLIYTYSSELMGAQVNYTGQLDVIATKLYQEHILPKLEELKDDYYKAIEATESDFIQSHKEDYGTAEYEKAYEEYKSKKEKLRLDYNQSVAEVNNAEKAALKGLLDMYNTEQERLNKHFGNKGVNAIAAKKMTTEGALIQNGGKVYYPGGTKTIPDCSDSTID